MSDDNKKLEAKIDQVLDLLGNYSLATAKSLRRMEGKIDDIRDEYTSLEKRVRILEEVLISKDPKCH